MLFRVAAVQLSAFDSDYERQMGKIEKLVSAAHQAGAAVICLPELMTTPYVARSQNLQWRTLAESLEDGPTGLRIAELAKKLSCTIIATCYEKEGAKLFNSAFIAGKDGKITGVYRKTHVPLIESVQAYETLFFDKGDALPVFEIEGVKTGILICYDRSFPEAWRTLALKGAQIVFVPTSSSGYRGNMYVDELRIAAAQHQIFIVAANKSGVESLPGEPGTITFYGKSSIIGPTGNLLSGLEQEENAFITTDLDLHEVIETRQMLNYYRDRRSDLYQL